MQPFERLEIEWSGFNGLDPAGMVCCASGTAALHLACEAMELPPGSEILIPDFTMIACPRAAVMAGLVPVFVDCGDDLLIDISLIGKAIEWGLDIHNINYGLPLKTKAVMWVAVYGRVNTNDRQYLADACTRHGMKLIEDLAEAHGVRPHPSTDAACWSFFKNKIVAGAEGGAVWFKDARHAELARNLRCLGFTKAHDYMHVSRGWNHRMSNVHADLVRSSLTSYWQNAAKRRKIEDWYEFACPPAYRMPSRDAVWVYDFRVPGMTAEQQDMLVRELRAAGIEARHFFKPMSAQPEFLSCRTVGSGKAAVASREGVYLPVQPGVTTEEGVRKAFQIIAEVLR